MYKGTLSIRGWPPLYTLVYDTININITRFDIIRVYILCNTSYGYSPPGRPALLEKLGLEIRKFVAGVSVSGVCQLVILSSCVLLL